MQAPYRRSSDLLVIAPAEQLDDQAGDLAVFAGFDHQGADVGTGSGDLGVRLGRGVRCLVDVDAEEPESGGGPKADRWRALAYPTVKTSVSSPPMAAVMAAISARRRCK